MGFHIANFNLYWSTERTESQVLAYGLGEDSDFVLGAVEYLVPQEGPYSESPPDLFTYDEGAEQWQEGPLPNSWALHVWVHTKNPDVG